MMVNIYNLTTPTMQTYATQSDVRTEAWFLWNPSITNELIEKYIIMWHSIVLSKISWKYDIINFTWSNFTDSQAETYLKTAEIMISAGLLLQKEFGSNYEDQKEGARRFRDWNDMLMQLYDTKNPVFLMWNDWLEYPRKSASQSWTIAWPDYFGSEPFFGVNMKI